MQPRLIALSSFLLLGSGCGADGNSPRADAQVGTIDASRTTDAPTALIDANLSVTDAGADAMGVADAGADAGTDAAIMAPSDVVINEFVFDHVGGSDTGEYAELFGLPMTDYSSLTLLQVDGDNGPMLNPGRVISAHAGCVTDSAGICEITVGANTFQNGSQTLLLVSGSAAFANMDLDADDDGVIDNTPWTDLLDAVSVFDNKPVKGNTDRSYAGNVVLNKTTLNGEPLMFGGASRLPDGMDTDLAADWVSNTPNIDNGGIATGEARNTPGAANTVEP